MAKVSNTMATEVKLDTVSAASSLKTLNNAIKATTNEWKANEISLKSAKDSLGAAQAKYEGLGKTMQALQAKIDKLKERQASLDTSTTKGSDNYARLSKDLANAENKMSSLAAQQGRAKKSVDYYQSGLADLQERYKSLTSVSKSYVEALENQGNKAQAGRAKLNGLRDSYRNLSDQLKIQQTELAKLKTSSGGASEAYNKQLVRVNQTTDSMAKQKTEIGRLAGKYGTMSNGMAKMSDRAAKARHRIANIGQAFKGAAITAAAGLTSLGAATIAGAKKATNLNKVYQVNKNLLVTSGEKARQAISQVSKMQRDGAKYSVKYGVAQKEIAEQYQDLIKRGHTGAEAIAVMKSELQASVASGDDFKDVIKVSSQAIEAFGIKTNNTAKMVKNTKRVVNDLAYASDVTATDFHSLGKGMEYVGDTAKNAGFSIEQTSAAMGELSNHGMEADKAGTGLRKTITSLASPTKTAMGALKEIGIKSTKIFQDAKGNLKSLPAIFKIIEEHTKKLGGADKADIFKRIFGQTGMQAAQVLTKYDGSLKKLTDEVTNAGKKGEYVQKLANKNSNNAKMNVERFKMAGQQLEIMIGSKLLPVITRAAQDMAKAFNNKDTQKGLTWMIGGVSKLASGFLKIIEFASKHTKTIAAFAVAFGSVLAVSKIARFVAATTEAIGVIKKLTAVQWLLNVAMDANPIGIAVVVIGALGAAFYEAYKHIKPFRKWVNKTAKSVVHFGKSIGKWAGHIGKSVKNGINRIGRNWNKFKSRFKKSWDKHWSAVGRKLKHSWNTSVHNTKSFFGSMGRHFHSFKRKFKKSWDKHWSAVGRKLKHSWNTSVHNTKSFFGSMGRHFHSFKRKFKKSWDKHWSAVGRKLKHSWNTSVHNTKSFFGSMGRHFHSFKRKFKKSWDKHWSAVGRKLKHSWNASVHNTKSFFGSMGRHFHSFRKRFSHSWTSHWNKMRSKLHSYWNKDLKHTKRFGTSMGHWLGAFKKSFKKGWTSLVSGVKHIFSHLWKDLKKLASNGMNDMINIINSGINLVDGVIHTFGGKKKAISDIGHVHFATGTGAFSGTRRAITKPTMAVLNDGNDSPETGNKEAVFLPNGQSGIVQGRNIQTMLPAGTEVLNASETKLLMDMQGIIHFAKGSSNWFGSLMSGIGSGIGDVSGWLVKKATGLKKFFTTAEKIIAHPIKSLNSMFNYTKAGAGVVKDITKGMFNKVKKQAGNWWSSLWSMVDLDGGSSNIKGIKSQVGSGFFKFMDKLANMFSSIGGSGGASYGGASMIEKAAKAMHVNLSAGELATIKSVIMHESGGNAKVIQKVHDINSASGHLAQGLLQFVPSTFSSYAVKGHKNILSAYDQLLAMFNDSNWRSDVHTGGWGPSGHRRYANGGISRFEKLAHISEGNKTESIIPWDITKRARAYQIMDSTMKEFAKTDKPQQSTAQSAQSTDLSELIKQGKEIIGLMAELISGQQNPMPAIVSANDVYSGYNRVKTRKSLSKNLGRGNVNGIQ
ncbi:phage tail tape measure protein [Levilactobacillus zymae]|uniref:phage tail tape measure protein n=1 Tax=Levilactobacillus zymae TaxID=267363 RepID=UPI0028BB6579|nr:phage tail tape measure protein [Levilactobacillus zymae]MDT6981712.1 phage tail tape measure protein [Levilactobacillus zymae]